MSENKSVVERHGCIVCGRTYNVLTIYSPDDRLVDCTVTSPGGHCIPHERHPLVACDTHIEGEIEAAYHRWKVRTVEEEQEKEDN